MPIDLRRTSALAGVSAIDGKPRSYPDDRQIAIESAQYFKRKNPMVAHINHRLALAPGSNVFPPSPGGSGKNAATSRAADHRKAAALTKPFSASWMSRRGLHHMSANAQRVAGRLKPDHLARRRQQLVHPPRRPHCGQPSAPGISRM
jgi:hypothetical protein